MMENPAHTEVKRLLIHAAASRPSGPHVAHRTWRSEEIWKNQIFLFLCANVASAAAVAVASLAAIKFKFKIQSSRFTSTYTDTKRWRYIAALCMAPFQNNRDRDILFVHIQIYRQFTQEHNARKWERERVDDEIILSQWKIKKKRHRQLRHSPATLWMRLCLSRRRELLENLLVSAAHDQHT